LIQDELDSGLKPFIAVEAQAGELCNTKGEIEARLNAQ
jgi:hypothetical protein